MINSNKLGVYTIDQKENVLTEKPASESYTVKASLVLPPDTNHHGTIFGGKLMAYIDDVATIAATRHARRPVVTASTDSVDFLHPVKKGDTVCLSAFVTWAHKTSMEVFVRVITENLLTGERKVCATSFLTFVALDENNKPTAVPGVLPQTQEEMRLYTTAPARKEARRIRRAESKLFAEELGVHYRPLERTRPHLRQVQPPESESKSLKSILKEKQQASSIEDGYSNCWGEEWN